MSKFFNAPSPFSTKPRKHKIDLIALNNSKYKSWIKKQSDAIQNQLKNEGFNGDTGQVSFVYDNKGKLNKVIAGISDPLSFYDFSKISNAVSQKLDDKFLKTCSFKLSADTKKQDIDKACISWALAAHKNNFYKNDESESPSLLWPNDANKKSVHAYIESICLVRDLVNTPANDMGPDELEAVTKALGKKHEATVSVIKDQKKLEKDFPLVFTVGKASPRKPRLIDLKWGNAKHPKVTLVGKGVCFDTGGLDLKPSKFMAHMKKDMGGSAHVLGVAQLIMAHKLPVRLRVLIPAVENAVAGNAFRPGDIIKSRKGLTVENTNTDAEGRLILADALTYACEDKPELVIDFATLTGSARAALGPDVPAMFCTDKKEAEKLQQASFAVEDPVWNMPLWEDYNKQIKSSMADLVNSAGLPGDLIYSALFLKKFVTDKPDWFHLDVYAWEQSGKAGRPKGGSDTAMRAVFSYLEKRYGK